MDRLTGADLLMVMRVAESMSRAQLLRLTGYVTTEADGGEQLDGKAFNEALLAASRAEILKGTSPGEPEPAPTPGAQVAPIGDLEKVNSEITLSMIKTVIALPLLDQLNAESKRRELDQKNQLKPSSPQVYEVIIDLHRHFPKGREIARRWVINTIEEIIHRNSPNGDKPDSTTLDNNTPGGSEPDGDDPDSNKADKNAPDSNKSDSNESDNTKPGQSQSNQLGESLDRLKRKFARQYLFASLTGDSIRELIKRDSDPEKYLRPGEAQSPIREEVKASLPQDEANKPIEHRAIFQIWEDFKVYPLLHGSVATIKADAARASFGAAGKGIVWAVVDSGIQADHLHFTEHKNLQGPVSEWHADFTGEGNPLRDGFGHGTHVAGIIAGEILPEVAADGLPPGDNPKIIAYTRSIKIDNQQASREVTCDRLPLASIRGVAPLTKLVSMKVIGENRQGAVSNIIAALARINEINSYGRYILIHGINLSVGYSFDPEWFACGQSQLCVEVNRLVRSGVVVVVAAGNTGYGNQASAFNGARQAGLALSINDPGNADGAITVGSTHRTMPHTYGVSYFSSKGPTGDGRLKPDLVAPGEKVLSCAGGTMAENIANKLPNDTVPNYVEDSGTSMAAPHVSGAAAAFLSIKNEFIGKPEVIKQILLSTATDLGRERQFQGAGLLDLMRAIQSL